MEARARLGNYRVSAQKARLVANEIRGRGVDDALTILDLSIKGFAKPLAKLVRSAVANAEEKNNRDHAGIDIDNLQVGLFCVGILASYHIGGNVVTVGWNKEPKRHRSGSRIRAQIRL